MEQAVAETVAPNDTPVCETAKDLRESAKVPEYFLGDGKRQNRS